ncbi:hypothetical protein ABPG72_017904 [Tetrahymena utriculariae]
MYIDSGDSLAQKTGSRKLIKKRSTFCPISKSSSSLDYEFNVKNFKIFDESPQLVNYMPHFEQRQLTFMECINQIFKSDYSLETFAQQYEQFGVQATPTGFYYKEYAPQAIEVYLTGDFNNWATKQYPLVNDGTGIWNLNLPEGVVIEHGSRICAYVRTSKNQYLYRVPIGARYIKKLDINNKDDEFCEIFWNPPQKFTFQHIHPHKPRVFKIYRAEIGKQGPEKRNYTYKEFAQNELQRIKDLGYNTILLVGLQEHESVGSTYSVVNPYSINSSAGTPDDLKQLVDKAHEVGLYVTMDIVQTHASPEKGFNQWDGSHFSYFIDGEQGIHPQHGGRLFNFAKWETQRLLLSNLGYFLNEYKIDGFRFVDVPSIIYKHHGNFNFSGNLDEYFGENSSIDGLVYLQLANETVHKINSNAVTFVEDESNYPSLCFPLEQGGIGFDYRISIKAADEFANYLCESNQVDFNKLISLLDQRLNEEKVISSLCYRSSDIILKNIKHKIQQVQDGEVQKHLSLHKIARMIVISYGGDSYLNRYGNEFGSSEEYFRSDLLGISPYKELLEFDRNLLRLEETHQILSMKEKSVTQKSNGILVFERADLIFVFNLNEQGQSNFKIGTKWNSDHNIIFSTDDAVFAGKARIGHSKIKVVNEKVDTLIVRPFHLVLDIPSHCGLILQPVDTEGFFEERKE